jgi:hypothetical protein
MADSSKSVFRNRRKKEEDEALISFDQEKYETHKSEVAVIMGHFFLRYLNLLYHEFEGDLVLPMVLGEIAHHNILRFYSPKGNCIEIHKQTPNYPERMEHFEPTNAYSLSEATGIPRETVRRKMDKLEKKKWIVKNDRGEVIISETVSEHFMKDFNKKLLAELLETTDCIRKLLEKD